MSTPSPAVLRLQFGTSHTKAAPASLNCISCDAEIADSANSCAACGAAQNREVAGIQEDEPAVRAERTPEMPSYTPEDPTVFGPDSWAATNQASNSAEAPAPDILGMMHQNGLGVAIDEPEAATRYRKAADQGDVDAQFNLGVMYENGHGGLARDDAQALSWYQKAADQGDAEAQYNLGLMFWYGLGGLAKDEGQAVYWLWRAADQGDVDAQFNLGVMYENRHAGLASDDAQALSWYQKAADQGDAEAQTNINWLKLESENADEPEMQVSIDAWCIGDLR